MRETNAFCFSMVSLFLLGTAPDFARAAQDSARRVVVLVPGVLFDATRTDEVREAQLNYWNDLIDSMKKFGECRLHIVEFDGPRVSIQPLSGKVGGFAVYTIVFSPEAAFDSLVYRAIELDSALREIGKRERDPITLMGHSAGGLESRIVVQEAIPGVVCSRQIDHVVMIATPHQGAALADNFGGAKGTRITSLQTTEPLIHKLNTLPLPQHIHFTSFILSSFGPESRKPGLAYTIPEFSDADVPDIPEPYLIGGDDAVHCISQNLMLTSTGAIRCRQPPAGMTTVLVRMPVCDEMPNRILGGLFATKTLHTSAMCHPEFCRRLCLSALGLATDKDYKQWQAECLVQCHVENLIKERSTFNEVVDIRVDSVTMEGAMIHYSATGEWVRFGADSDVFTGDLQVKLNPTFGVLVVE